MTLVLGVDGMCLSRPLTGVGNYTFRLLRALALYTPVQPVVGLYSTLGEPRPDLTDLEEAGVRCIDLPPNRGRLVSRSARWISPLPVELMLAGCDAYLYPNFRWLPSLRSRPTITVIHDLAFLRQEPWVPEPYRSFLRRAVPRALKRSTHIITPSEAVRVELQNEYPRVGAPITAVHPLPHPDWQGGWNPRTPPYVLFVGTREPRKGLERAVQAVQVAREQRPDLDLVVAGGRGWNDEAIVSMLGENESWLHVVESPTDDVVYDLLSGASVLIAPSRYEGFGMPLLEARQVGTPVVATDLPAHREAGGDWAHYVELDADDMADTLLKVMSEATHSSADPTVKSGRRSAEGVQALLRDLT